MGDKLYARVRGVLISPRSELPKTIAEPGDVRSVVIPYVLALVSLGAAAQFVSRGIIGVYVPPQMLLGTKFGGGFLRLPVAALIGSILSIVIGVGAWWLLSFVLLKLAPKFGARSDANGARKAAAYMATPIWLAGALALFQSIPYLGIVTAAGQIAGLAYAVFLGMQTLPLLMGTPEPKAVGHALAGLALTAVAAIVATAVMFMLVLR
jgi:hypothetical protein